MCDELLTNLGNGAFLDNKKAFAGIKYIYPEPFREFISMVLQSFASSYDGNELFVKLNSDLAEARQCLTENKCTL